MTARLPAILAVDGGNSKADVALVAADGSVLGAVRGPTISHQAVGLEAGLGALERSVDRVLDEAGQPRARRPAAGLGVYTLAGADLRSDVRLLDRGLQARAITDDRLVLNDTYAPLRAGSDRAWGVVVVCGAGTNGLGIGPSGRVVRFAAVGENSGDRGAGGGLAVEALAAAIRGRDGRGPRTTLERLVPAAFGRSRPGDLTTDLELGRLDRQTLRERLPPIVFAAAGDGDPVAARLVADVADEIVAWAGAMIRRLHLTRTDVPVVLSGGIIRTAYAPFHDRIRTRIATIAPAATVRALTVPPVVGAALLGLDRLGLARAELATAEARLRTELTFARLGVGPA